MAPNGEIAQLISQLTAISNQAAAYYQRIFGADYGIPGVSPISLPLNYFYLKRDAYDKWVLLSQGFLFGGHRRRDANLYAVNADFKKDILERTNQIVQELQRLDQEERRLRQELNTFRVSQVSATGEISGVQVSQLQTQNYSTDVQTQISQFQGQMQSLDKQVEQETNEIKLKASIIPPAREMFGRKWANLMNVKATPASAPDVLQVSASSNAFVPVPGGMAPGTNLFVQATGRWTPRGTVVAGYVPFHGQVPSDAGLNQSMILPMFSSPTGLLSHLDYPNVPDPDGVVSNALTKGTLDSDAGGIVVSDSESLSASVSDGNSTGFSAGFGIGPFSIGGSQGSSEGASKSRSKSQGITAGYKSQNADLPSANIGALIAQMTGPGLTAAQQVPFFVGQQNVIQIPSNATGNVTVSFMQNDAVGAHGGNSGTVSVQLTKSVDFAAYVPAFLAWFTKDCDPQPDGSQGTTNCGFQALVDQNRIGTEQDPQGFARSAFQAFLQTYPANLQPVPPVLAGFLQDVVSASVNLAMANHDLDLAIHKSELTRISAMQARDSLELSQQKVATTRQIIESIQRQQDSIQKKNALLAAGTEFYETELANLLRLKANTLARAQRYLGITVDSFNYLYLTNFKLQGQPQLGFEGDFYAQILNIITDQIQQVDSNDDLLNPNRGFITYDLTPAQVQELKATGKTAFTFTAQGFFCKGFGIEDQVRVLIEKVGYLLDIDPVNEQLFFKNPNVRRMPVRTTHGNLNLHYDLDANPIEYYLPMQSKEISAFSQRILTDFHSDFTELGLSNTFQRASFRNTSFQSDWGMALLDTVDFDLRYLKGIKFVVYFTSTEAHGNKVIQSCSGLPLGTTIQKGKWN